MPVKITAENWEEEVLKSKIPVIVEFWHDKCPYCAKFNPVYKETEKEYDDIKFAQLNIRESRENYEIAKKYGIMGTPTLKFFCKGRVIGELIGHRPKEQLMEEIDNTLKKRRINACVEQSTLLKDLYT
ncbi:MAG: thioredoxin family protein [Candidatus Korarchaeota archaeon]|nr:thioredoxin family protein [Candidatus Korarchaeota archaeon]NIU84713.1 thioredoxin fold domain-containing protein [Candidatus Thorarchaeota archaeon]NIW14715.1 thioredoxin fold domain-containing protein [Candidatus Thorarchaeota archaeon]NIW52789.1 thioredoxin fold domain-containing protein [Candidatus Korarchaeota archaeon]